MIFEQRLQEVKQHNSKARRLWTAGINHLSDWTEEELRGIRGWQGGVPAGAERTASFLVNSVRDAEDMPKAHEWNATYIGLAANQGSCGSCWAVAASKMAEANHHIHTGGVRSFSAQELIDCVANPQSCGGTGGCKGATVELAMWRMMEHGLAKKEDVPYRGHDQACVAPTAAPALLQQAGGGDAEFRYAGMTLVELVKPGIKQVSSPAAQQINMQYWERLPVNSGSALKQRLLQGTVAVSVMADGWQLYQGGIYDGCEKDAVIDHAVLAVGFGADESGAKYWKILNSWSPFWGELGKIRLLMTEDDYCGMDKKPEEGTGCRGGPKSVKVCGMCGVYYDNVYSQFGSIKA